MKLRLLSLAATGLLCSLLMAQQQFPVVVQGHVAGCNPAIAGGTVLIQSIQGTMPSVSMEVALNENCFYQYTFLMIDTAGWFQVSVPCGNGAMDNNAGLYFINGDSAVVVLDLQCDPTETDCIGIPNGPNLPGTPCSDGDPTTVNDEWTADCDCVGTLTTCIASFSLAETSPFNMSITNTSTVNGLVDYNWTLPLGGSSQMFDPADMTFPQTGDYQILDICLEISGVNCASWMCDTIVVDPAGSLSFGPVYFDCEGVLNGPALPGTACDDGDPDTENDHWTEFCNCEGTDPTSNYTVTIEGHITDCSPAIAGGLVTITNPYDQTTLATTTLNANCFYQITIPVNSPMDSLWVSASCMDGSVATNSGVYQVNFFGTDTLVLDLDCNGVEPTECEAGYWVIQAYDSANGQIEPIPFELWVWNLSTGSGNFQFLWNFGDGTTSSDPYPTHVYSGAGPYELCLQIWDATGCTDTYCSTISVDGDGLLGMAGEGNDRNVLTLNVLQSSVSTSIEDGANIGDLMLYPNPASEQLTISLNSTISGNTMLSIIDVNGRLVRTLSSTFNKGTNKLSIPVIELADGIYSIRIENAGSSITHRFVKSK